MELDPLQTGLDIVTAKPATGLYVPIYQGRNMGGWEWDVDVDVHIPFSARGFNANVLKQLFQVGYMFNRYKS